MKTRTFAPCRRCGAEHQNPRSSSLCETCGPIVRAENEANQPFQMPWHALDWGDKYDRDPKQAFLELVERAGL